MYCFPNKLLQSLLSGLPVVVSRLVELERMVSMTGAGIVVDETDPKAIAGAIAEILADPGRYRPKPARIRSLETSHGWPAQEERLLACYQKLDRPDAFGAGAKASTAGSAPMFGGGPPG
jgi:glycosyltransferase involved in cell wall biosynthesis